MNKQTVELFCGTKSFSNIATKLGFETWTTDNDPVFMPTKVIDILDLNVTEIPRQPYMLWASPPCESFSVASIGKHWNRDNTPKTNNAVVGLKLLEKTIELIASVRPEYWFIENPRGKMRKIIEPIIIKHLGNHFKRETICYCRYSDTRMKPTDIWTNCMAWEPVNRMCHNGNPDHEAAPRGAKTGTQGIEGYADRSRIPSALFEDIFEQIIKT
jgi:hypothetical protein